MGPSLEPPSSTAPEAGRKPRVSTWARWRGRLAALGPGARSGGACGVREELPAHLHPALPAGVSWTLSWVVLALGNFQGRGVSASPPFPGAALSWAWREEGPQDSGLGGPSSGRKVGSPALVPSVEGGPTHGHPQGPPGGHWTLHWRLLAGSPPPHTNLAEWPRFPEREDGKMLPLSRDTWQPPQPPRRAQSPLLSTQGAGRGLWQRQVLGISWSAAVRPGEATPRA